MDIQPPIVIADLLAEAPVPQRGILSQTLSKGDGVELVLFAFAAGEALTEHTSARPAIIHVLSGEGALPLPATSTRLAREPGSGCRPTAGTASRPARPS